MEKQPFGWIPLLMMEILFTLMLTLGACNGFLSPSSTSIPPSSFQVSLTLIPNPTPTRGPEDREELVPVTSTPSPTVVPESKGVYVLMDMSNSMVARLHQCWKGNFQKTVRNVRPEDRQILEEWWMWFPGGLWALIEYANKYHNQDIRLHVWVFGAQDIYELTFEPGDFQADELGLKICKMKNWTCKNDHYENDLTPIFTCGTNSQKGCFDAFGLVKLQNGRWPWTKNEVKKTVFFVAGGPFLSRKSLEDFRNLVGEIRESGSFEQKYFLVPCIPSGTEVPSIPSAYEELRNQKVPVLSLMGNGKDSSPKLLQWMTHSVLYQNFYSWLGLALGEVEIVYPETGQTTVTVHGGPSWVLWNPYPIKARAQSICDICNAGQLCAFQCGNAGALSVELSSSSPLLVLKPPQPTPASSPISYRIEFPPLKRMPSSCNLQKHKPCQFVLHPQEVTLWIQYDQKIDEMILQLEMCAPENNTCSDIPLNLEDKGYFLQAKVQLPPEVTLLRLKTFPPSMESSKILVPNLRASVEMDYKTPPSNPCAAPGKVCEVSLGYFEYKIEITSESTLWPYKFLTPVPVVSPTPFCEEGTFPNSNICYRGTTIPLNRAKAEQLCQRLVSFSKSENNRIIVTVSDLWFSHCGPLLLCFAVDRRSLLSEAGIGVLCFEIKN